MKKYKHVFFDFDNTLWDFTQNSKESLHQIYTKYNLERFFKDFETFYNEYEKTNQELWEEYRQGNISRETLSIRRFYFISELLDIQKYTPEALNREYLALTTQKTKVIDYAHEILQYLKNKYSVHIITDGFFEVQIIKLQTAKINPLIDKVITAEEIGVLKPNKKLFDYALEKTGASKEESIMIGDDYDNDIIGAMNAGIDQIFFNTKGIKNLPKKPTFEISKLEEIKNIL